MLSNFVNSWQKYTVGTLEQTQMHREPHLVSCVRIYRVKLATISTGLYQNGPKPKRPRPKRPTNFWHVHNGPHQCPKRPNAGTKRPRAMTKTAQSWIRSVSCSACSLYEWRALSEISWNEISKFVKIYEMNKILNFVKKLFLHIPNNQNC